MDEDNNKAKILECALELFADKGYDGVGINAICEEAELSKPTLYYYFGSKAGLFGSILYVYYGKLEDVLRKVCVYHANPESYEEDVKPVLINIAKTYINFAKNNQTFYRMMMALHFVPQNSTAAEISDKYHKIQYEYVEEIFQQFANVHENLRGKARLSALSFISAINAQIAFWLRGYSPLDDHTVESLVKQFMHGIFS
jgi:TetR/AcrR family transcriptional regulator